MARACGYDRAMRVFLLLGFVVACGGGDDVDLTGMYRVEGSVRSEPCGADQPDPAAPAFIRFTKDEFLGAPYYSYESCADEAGTNCGGSAGLFGGLFEPIDGGWRGVVTSSSPFDGMCALGYAEQTAILDGSALVIEASRYGETVALPEAQCEPEEAERRGDAMPCEAHSRVDATRLSTR